VSVDRSRCLETFRHYNDTTGTEIISFDDVEAMGEAELALFWPAL